ncbi:MAG: FAD-dependent oxidoreductase, partial [Bacteroidota bacterium]
RQGATVLLVEEGPWVGGMLTAAGVSAIDGNHRIAGGLWREFRDSLYAHYGGPEAVATGWVSNTLFEPAIGQRILRNMLRQEPRITLRLHFRTARFRRNPGYWSLVLVRPDVYEESLCQARVLIDATELGDIAHRHGVPRDVGMDARSVTSESFAPERANDIIQDLTYVLTLQDYGEQADKTIPRPPGYDPEIFRCACDVADPSGQPTELLDCAKLLTYGRLPNHKYMINWPNCGNDHYLNLLGKNPEERRQGLDSAKVRSLRFLYFLQHELGYRNLGLAADEYPTTDGLPLIPYHRESGRIHGLVRFTVDDLLRPYDRPDPLYRTSIAVGDYPIDHHHKERPDAPDIDFIRIKAPAYGLPLGTLLPRGFPGLIVAEKSISVSNIV